MDEPSTEPTDAKQPKKGAQPSIRKLIWLPVAVALGVQYALVAPSLIPADTQVSHQAQSANVTYEITVSPQGQVLQSTAKPAPEQGASPAASAFLGAANNNPTAQSPEISAGQSTGSTVTQQVQGTVGQRIIAAKIAHKQAVKKRVEQLAAARMSDKAKAISKLRVNGATISTELAERLAAAEPDYALHIEYIDQDDVLPSGCEIVALTVVMHSMGYENAEATDIADDYIEYGGNNMTQYTGSPYDNGGCLSACIVNAANKWLDNGAEKQGDNSVKRSADDDDDDKDASDASSKSTEKESASGNETHNDSAVSKSDESVDSRQSESSASAVSSSAATKDDADDADESAASERKNGTSSSGQSASSSSAASSSATAASKNDASEEKSSASSASASSAGSSSKSRAAEHAGKSTDAAAKSKSSASKEKSDQGAKPGKASAGEQKQAKHLRETAKQIVARLIAGGTPAVTNSSASSESAPTSASGASSAGASSKGSQTSGSSAGASSKASSDASAASASSTSASTASKSSSSASAERSQDAKPSKESAEGKDGSDDKATEKAPALPIDDACAYDLTGTSYKDLCELVKLGYPVLVWTTEGMTTPSVWSTWYHPEHCVVLYGFKGDDALVSDSLAGLVKRDNKRFGEIYETVGMRAAFICPKAHS